jgi:hypothetical protein
MGKKDNQMKLRYKINLITVGWCGLGALITAAGGRLGLAAICLFLAWWNWTIALASEIEPPKEHQ